jgi:hypothetical protein
VPVLLIVDNKLSHQGMEAIELARDSGVIILSIPQYTAHNLQPLDVAVYKTFKSFERAVDVFQKNYPGSRVNKYDVSKLVKTAYEKSATVENATHGFHKRGILPFNAYLFTDLDFAPSEVRFVAPVNKMDGVLEEAETCGILEKAENVGQQNKNFRAQIAEPRAIGSPYRENTDTSQKTQSV